MLKIKEDLNSEKAPLQVFCSAGEVSGDLALGQILGHPFFSERFRFEFWGLGGISAVSKGLKPEFALSHTAFNGISDVLIHLFSLTAIFLRIRKRLINSPPRFAILVDYPGMNLKFLKILKKLNTPILYVLPPQGWVYKAKKLSLFQNVQVIVQFTFEASIYQRQGAKVFKGHFFKISHPSKKSASTLLVCPGSRPAVIRRNLPHLLKRVDQSNIIKNAALNIKVLLPVEFKALGNSLITRHSRTTPVKACCNCDIKFSEVKYAISFPGSLTMELFLHRIPTLIWGKIDSFTYFLAKMCLKVKYTALPNLLLARPVFQEVIFPSLAPPSLKKFDSKMAELMSGKENWPIKALPIAGEKGPEIAASIFAGWLKTINPNSA